MLLTGDSLPQTETHALASCAPERFEGALVAEECEEEPEGATAESLIELLGARWMLRDSATYAVIDARCGETVANVYVPVVGEAETVDFVAEVVELFACFIVKAIMNWAYSMDNISLLNTDRISIFLP